MSRIFNQFLKDEYLKNLDCTNELLQGYTVSIHEISNGEYDAMKKDYFGVPGVADASFSMVSINACADKVYFLADADNIDDNTDVSVTTTSGKPAPPYNNTITSSYSSLLFKGIIEAFNPDTILASKAVDSNSNNCIIFKVVKNNVVVYCGDLSDMMP